MAAITISNMLTLLLPQVGLTIVKVIQWTRTGTVACSSLLLLLLLLMMCNTLLHQACQQVDCCLLCLPCCQPVVVTEEIFASIWKRLLAVLVATAIACCAVHPNNIATCHCYYHWWIACGIYKIHLPVLSPVALGIVIVIAAGWLSLPLTKNIACFCSHCRDEL